MYGVSIVFFETFLDERPGERAVRKERVARVGQRQHDAASAFTSFQDLCRQEQNRLLAMRMRSNLRSFPEHRRDGSSSWAGRLRIKRTRGRTTGRRSLPRRKRWQAASCSHAPCCAPNPPDPMAMHFDILPRMVKWKFLLDVKKVANR